MMSLVHDTPTEENKALSAHCHTLYDVRMTMMSFRVDDDEAARAQRWADKLGIDKSELLRDALHRHLVRLASEHDAVAWVDQPLAAGEAAISEIADWGPAEDWTDWADATR
jgi:predicted transcriptional regulator